MAILARHDPTLIEPLCDYLHRFEHSGYVPIPMSCSSGTTRLALGQFAGNSRRSTHRAVYHPARCHPIRAEKCYDRPS